MGQQGTSMLYKVRTVSIFCVQQLMYLFGFWIASLIMMWKMRTAAQKKLSSSRADEPANPQYETKSEPTIRYVDTGVTKRSIS
ncbi:hypothetical protein Ocin01_15402 [Orchesella cincta]|uniref:Uncharacterized protein n=1 Tax=Orchesella cincta TaxID=48709 RepID=A0A1D2MEJ8_ORCCI|nr:hypothetical protein Ocin01_15402 [Orchesella cincta]